MDLIPEKKNSKDYSQYLKKCIVIISVILCKKQLGLNFSCWNLTIVKLETVDHLKKTFIFYI